MVMYAQLANQDKTKGMIIDEYLKDVLELNPQFERVFCR